MTEPVCFKCGHGKTGALSACQQCGSIPLTEDELSLSLVLCEHLSSESQLAYFAHEIKNGLRLKAPERLLAQAREALKDPQLMAMLGVKRQAVQPTATAARDTQRPATSQQASRTTSPRRRSRSLKETALHRNAFWLLGATTRDDRRRIVELAEEKSLELDHDACQKARSDLTSPRTRLGAEMAWLPGVSPRKAVQLAGQVLQDPMSVRVAESGLPSLAHTNLMAAAFEAVDATDVAEDIAKFIQEMAYLVDELSVDDVMRDINEDRAVSGFPEVKAEDQVEAELA